VKADFGGVTGVIVDGEDVKAAQAIGDAALGEESLCGAGDHALLVSGDAEFGKRGEVVAQRARADFDEGQRFAVVADEVELTFDAARRVVAGYEDVTVPAQIPVGVRFAANAGATRGVFALGLRMIVIVAEAFACGPADQLEDTVGEEGHGASSIGQ